MKFVLGSTVFIAALLIANLLHAQLNNPDDIQFMAVMTNNYVTASTVSAQAIIMGGIPFYEAVLVNDTNLDDANWQPYASSNIVVNLGATDGVYNVRIGLRGSSANATPKWDTGDITFYRESASPIITFTSPTNDTLTRPYVQIQGYADKPLRHISYDLENALGQQTDLQGFVTDQEYDTNSQDYTRNYFQCYDLALTNGINTITLRFTDRSGNVTTTNLNLTLDYSGATNLPVITLVWPQDGSQISDDAFTLRGTINDETASVNAQIVDTNGDTNVMSGTVERHGEFWVEDLPLTNGANTITVTATDAAGNVATTNLTVLKSGVILKIDSTPAGDDLYKTYGTVIGEISDNTYNVTVNGAPAAITGTQNAHGNWIWTATNVPILGQGTATFDARATPRSQSTVISTETGKAP